MSCFFTGPEASVDPFVDGCAAAVDGGAGGVVSAGGACCWGCWGCWGGVAGGGVGAALVGWLLTTDGGGWSVEVSKAGFVPAESGQATSGRTGEGARPPRETWAVAELVGVAVPGVDAAGVVLDGELAGFACCERGA